MTIPNSGRARPFLRALQGGIAGAAIGALEYASWPSLHGWVPPPEYLPELVVACAAVVSFAWLVLELGMGLLPPTLRPGRRLFLVGSLTTGAFVVSQRLVVGELELVSVRFPIEFAVVFGLVALAVRTNARLEGRRWIRGAALAGSSLLVVAITIVGQRVAVPPLPRSTLPTSEGRNVVLLLVDTLRIDRLSLFGASRATTPFLESLAEESLVFERAYTPSPWTSPSVASMFTGKTVRNHGLDAFGKGLSPGIPVMAERFHRLGYETFGTVGNAIVGSSAGFSRGFSTYRAPEGSVFFQSALGVPLQRAATAFGLEKLWREAEQLLAELLPDGWSPYRRRVSLLVSDFRDFLAGHASHRPFFAYLHFIEPHDPYDPPRPFRGRFGGPLDGKGLAPPSIPDDLAPTPDAELDPERAKPFLDAYDEEILAIDAAIRDVVTELAARERLDDTVLVVVSDHGEEFGDHGSWRHGTHCFDELVRGLLVVRFPTGKPQGTVDQPVSLRELAGGRLDLVEVARGRHPDWSRDLAGRVLVEHYPSPNLDRAEASFAVVDGDWKLVRFRSAPEDPWVDWLFDLERDPGERTDLAKQYPEVTSRLRRWLDGRIGEDGEQGTRAPAVGPSVTEALRALGYVQ